jgi:murein DD-endopeptidase MepM/ murein hydrolase activator NlpD
MLTVPCAAEEKPNFYIPSKPAAEKKESSGNKAEEPKTTPKPKPSPAPVKEKPAQSPTPKKPATEAGKKEPAARTENLKLTRRENAPEKPFKPPLDGFGLARAFEHRWDFTSFLISTQEELKYRLDAARAKTLRIARAFSALSSEVEIRQRNLNAAALAAYLLSRDQATWSPVGGRNLTEAQMLAVRVTMRQDMAAMQSALTDYETLRNSLNESAEHVADLEQRGLAASPPNALASVDIPMLPLTEVARAQTESVLEEHSLSVETLKAILSSEMLSTTGDERQSIASFAPPPPGGLVARSKFITSSTPPGAPVPGAALEDNLQPARRQQNAVLIPTGVNAPVHAVRKGVVVYAGPFRGYGGMVIIEHEKGTFSVYSHLGSIQVRERQSVAGGEVLGRAGTPPELGRSGIHFQVRRGKENIAPAEWLGTADFQKILAGG